MYTRILCVRDFILTENADFFVYITQVNVIYKIITNLLNQTKYNSLLKARKQASRVFGYT